MYLFNIRNGSQRAPIILSKLRNGSLDKNPALKPALCLTKCYRRQKKFNLLGKIYRSFRPHLTANSAPSVVYLQLLYVQETASVTGHPYNLAYYVVAHRTIYNDGKCDNLNRYHNILKSGDICISLSMHKVM